MSLVPAGAAQAAPFVFPVRWVRSDKELEEACAKWMQCQALALDTEFERVKTFWPILALIQLCDGEEVTLIDPLKIQHWQCFARVLTAPHVVKVMHAAGEDLEAFAQTCNALVVPLFDTQTALAFAGFGSSVGLAAVVKERYGQELSKETARTDWLARPLSEDQVKYAVTDVVYLLDMHQQLREALTAVDRMALVDSEGQLACEKVQFTEPEDVLYRRLKQASVLRAQELMLAQTLAQWREQEAKATDISRNHLLRDETIVALAQQPPKSWNELAAITSIHPKILRLHGKVILDVIAEAKTKPSAQWPKPVSRLLDISKGRELQEALLQSVKQWSANSAIPSELVFSKRGIETLIIAVADEWEQAPFIWRGWRKATFATPMSDILTAFNLNAPTWW